MSELKQAKREGVIRFGYDFDQVGNVVELFGAKKNPFETGCRIPEKEDTILWFVENPGTKRWHNVPQYGKVVDDRGWNELLGIEEYNDDKKVSENRVSDELAYPRERLVFWKEQRDGTSWIKFYGVFKINVEKTVASQTAGENHVFYDRISTETTCPVSKQDKNEENVK